MPTPLNAQDDPREQAMRAAEGANDWPTLSARDHLLSAVPRVEVVEYSSEDFGRLGVVTTDEGQLDVSATGPQVNGVPYRSTGWSAFDGSLTVQGCSVVVPEEGSMFWFGLTVDELVGFCNVGYGLVAPSVEDPLAAVGFGSYDDHPVYVVFRWPLTSIDRLEYGQVREGRWRKTRSDAGLLIAGHSVDSQYASTLTLEMARYAGPAVRPYPNESELHAFSLTLADAVRDRRAARGVDWDRSKLAGGRQQFTIDFGPSR
jgi:hypothetical protein